MQEVKLGGVGALMESQSVTQNSTKYSIIHFLMQMNILNLRTSNIGIEVAGCSFTLGHHVCSHYDSS